MRLPSFRFLAGTAFSTILRFPLAMATMATAVVVAIILTEYQHEKPLENQLIQLLFTAFLAWPFFLGIRFSEEKYHINPVRAWVVKLLALAFFVLYFFVGYQPDFDSPEVIFRLLALILLGHLYVSFAAFRDKEELRGFWVFNQNILLHFLEAAVVAVIIGAGLSLALLALEELFKVDISTTFYMDLVIVIAGIFHPLYFLSKTPSLWTSREEKYISYPAFTNIVRYVLIPLVALYFLILYAFSAKILLSWELPEGWVSKMVLGFSIAGIFTYLVNYRMAEHENSSILSGFRKWYFPVLAPMVLLILVAIGRRIGDYGFTEGRYVVLTLGIWLGLVSLYFIFSKKDDIRVIPVSLAFFAFLSIVGPWSAADVSFNSQEERLRHFLSKENLLQNGFLSNTGQNVEKESIRELTSILDFLIERDSARLREEFNISDTISMDVPSIMQSINLKPDQNRLRGNANSFRYYSLKKDAPISIEGFKFLYQFHLYGGDKYENSIVKLSEEGNSLILSSSSIIEIDLADYFKRISSNKEGMYDFETLSFTFTWSGVSGKVFFENLNLEITGREIKANSMTGTILWNE